MTASQRNPTLPWLDFNFKAMWGYQSPKLQLGWSFSQICLHIVASSNQQLHFSQFSLVVLLMPHPTPTGIRAWSTCTCPWGRAAKCHYWLCESDSCYRQPHPPQAYCHWNFGARQVHGGTLEDHTSSRAYFIQDGLIGSLHKCLGLDGADEEFVWNEGWLEKHQQLALTPWLPCL